MRFKRNMAHLAVSLRALALLMLVPTVCHAGGFALNELSARGNAMGGAVIAIPGDASTVIYNPAGMTQLEGAHALVGFTAIAPTADVKAGSGSKTTLQTNIYTPPHAYYVQQLTDKVWFGIGEYTRFGLGTQYGFEWAGTTKTYMAELSSYSIAPNLAIKLTDNLSVALGPEIIYSSADLRKRPTSTTDMRMKVDGVGFGFQAAMHYKINEEWSTGFVYHSPQKQSDSGHVRYTEQAGPPLLRNQALTINMTLPASYSLGVGYKPNKDWKIEADATFTQWQDYEKLEYNFENQADVISWKNWRNVWRFQLGGEYMAADWLALRAGFVWDQDPIRKGYEDYMLPTNDRKIYSVGFGLLQDKLTYDFSLMYLVNNDRSMDANPNLKGATKITNSKAYMAGVSIGYKF